MVLVRVSLDANVVFFMFFDSSTGATLERRFKFFPGDGVEAFAGDGDDVFAGDGDDVFTGNGVDTFAGDGVDLPASFSWPFFL